MKTRPGVAITIESIVWAAVILAASRVLKGTPQPAAILRILGGGAAATIVLLSEMSVRERRA